MHVPLKATKYQKATNYQHLSYKIPQNITNLKNTSLQNTKKATKYKKAAKYPKSYNVLKIPNIYKIIKCQKI